MYKRNINWLPLAHPQLRSRPTVQACALTGNWTGDLSVCRMTPNPLKHTHQGTFKVLSSFKTRNHKTKKLWRNKSKRLRIWNYIFHLGPFIFWDLFSTLPLWAEWATTLGVQESCNYCHHCDGDNGLCISPTSTKQLYFHQQSCAAQHIPV